MVCQRGTNLWKKFLVSGVFEMRGIFSVHSLVFTKNSLSGTASCCKKKRTCHFLLLNTWGLPPVW